MSKSIRVIAAVALAAGALTIGVVQGNPVSAHANSVACVDQATSTWRITNDFPLSETFTTAQGPSGAVAAGNGSFTDIVHNGDTLTVTGTWTDGHVEVNTGTGDCSPDVVETTDPPVETTEPPVETTEPPVETTDPPVETTEPPVETTEPPVESTEPPVETTIPIDASFDIDVEGTCSNTLTVTIGGGPADLYAYVVVNGTPIEGPLGTYAEGIHQTNGSLDQDVTIVLTITATFEDGTVLSDTVTVVANCAPPETTDPPVTTEVPPSTTSPSTSTSTTTVSVSPSTPVTPSPTTEVTSTSSLPPVVLAQTLPATR